MTADTLHFAHISDIHFSRAGNNGFMLAEESPRLLRTAFQQLNERPDLDFVFISGDCLNSAHRSELDHFQGALAALKKPYFIVPGNHDGDLSADPDIFDQRFFAAQFNPHFGQRPRTGQAGYFSVPLAEGVQFIGLDTTIPGQTGGVVDAAQLAWLEAALREQSARLVIVGCHHPLHPLTRRDETGLWREMFVCANGQAVQGVLEGSPAVRLVLYGHHHMTRITRRGGQLHVASPALVSYPCTYRLFWVTQNANGWLIRWQMQPAPPEVTAEAARLLYESDFSREYDPDPQAFVDLAGGDTFEWAGEITIIPDL